MRYKILRETEGGNSCFDFSVLDTNKINSFGYYDWICGCLEEKDAIKVCESLNGGNHEFTDTDGVAK